MPTATRPITPEDMADFARLDDVQISPDGALVAFVAGDQFKIDSARAKSRIWVAPTNGGAARPFTAGPRTDNTPRWSPDGGTLAFLSDRLEDGRQQIYLLDRAGPSTSSGVTGEARRLTDLQGEINELEWSPDGTQLAFLLTDPGTEEEQRRKQAKDDAIEVERNHKWRRVWTVDVVSGATRQITSGDAQIWEFSWAPDGGFALLVGPEPYEWSWFVARLARVGADGGLPEIVYSVPEKQFASPRVSPDGTQLAFLSCIWSDRGINGGDVFIMRLETGDWRLEDSDADVQQAASLQPSVSNLTAGYRGSIWWIQWSADSASLDYIAYEDGEAAIGRIDVATGARITRWKGAVAFAESASSRYIARETGAIAVLREDAIRPHDLWLAEPQEMGVGSWGLGAESPTPISQLPSPGDWHQLTHFHPQSCERALGETRVLRWQGADGMAVQGLLILPVGYQEGARAPLITRVHGGPAWLYTHSFYGAGRYPQQLFAGAGYAVLLANPRGSAGWGVEFTEANIGDFGGRDYEDIIAGVDHVIALGIADPAWLGIGGWSYGGFMTAWAVTQTKRFKAAMMGAGICNWRSFHGVAEIGAWDQISYRASPYEQGGRYDRFSAIHYVDRVTTPTLIVHGMEDVIVPVGQSYEFFRGLKDHGVPTELVVYPREPHGFRERGHNIDRFRRFLAWFQRYI